jgi:dolichyldiphosphatase
MTTAMDQDAFVYSFVEYPRGSIFGQCLALVSLFPIFILSAYAVLLLSRRDLHTFTLLVGQVANEAVNHVLKYALREPRLQPSVHPQFDAMSPYAFPSDHAQFTAFLAVYVLLWAPRRWLVSRIWRQLASSAGLASCALVSVSRVWLHYHTITQVAAGLAIGAALGTLWFFFTEAALRPQFAQVARHPLATSLLIRDCTHVNVIAAEYKAASRGSKSDQYSSWV